MSRFSFILDQRMGPRLLVRFLLAFWTGFIKGIGYSPPPIRLASGARLARSCDPRGFIVDILELVEEPALPPILGEGIYLADVRYLDDEYSFYSEPPDGPSSENNSME